MFISKVGHTQYLHSHLLHILFFPFQFSLRQITETHLQYPISPEFSDQNNNNNQNHCRPIHAFQTSNSKHKNTHWCLARGESFPARLRCAALTFVLLVWKVTGRYVVWDRRRESEEERGEVADKSPGGFCESASLDTSHRHGGHGQREKEKEEVDVISLTCHHTRQQVHHWRWEEESIWKRCQDPLALILCIVMLYEWTGVKTM